MCVWLGRAGLRVGQCGPHDPCAMSFRRVGRVGTDKGPRPRSDAVLVASTRRKRNRFYRFIVLHRSRPPAQSDSRLCRVIHTINCLSGRCRVLVAATYTVRRPPATTLRRFVIRPAATLRTWRHIDWTPCRTRSRLPCLTPSCDAARGTLTRARPVADALSPPAARWEKAMKKRSQVTKRRNIRSCLPDRTRKGHLTLSEKQVRGWEILLNLWRHRHGTARLYAWPKLPLLRRPESNTARVILALVPVQLVEGAHLCENRRMLLGSVFSRGSPAWRSSGIQVWSGGGTERLFSCMLRPRRHGACSRSRDRRVRASGPCRRRPRAASTSSTSLATADDRPAPSTVRSRAQ